LPTLDQTRAELPVLIVGAGPTGLTLACDLARRGVNLRIIDKSPTWFAGSRGKGLQPRSLELLDDLGIVDQILANGRFHLPFRAYDGPTVLGDLDMHEGRHPTPDVPYASVLIIPQFRVEELLRKLLATWGLHVELATELIDTDQNEETVTATVLRDGQHRQITAQYVVAADGGRSFLRKHLDVGFAGETWKDERMLVGDVQADVLDHDHWHSWPRHKDGWVALCPLPSTNAHLEELRRRIRCAVPDPARRIHRFHRASWNSPSSQEIFAKYATANDMRTRLPNSAPAGDSQPYRPSSLLLKDHLL
jgi:2-polyprenyl-6-methoxyphenol hydroxylase-like FAD-dependent oxidoreductase